MATTTPLAYNTGAPIGGTTQVGNLAVGNSNQDYSTNPGGIPWWMGPNEETGYVIAKPVSGNTQPTPVLGNNIYLSPTYKGTDINLSNNNQTAYQQFGYQQSVLGVTPIGSGDTSMVMFSVLCTLADPPALPGSHFVGIGYTTMNYQGNPYGGFPGNDNQSMGYGSDGTIWYNGSVYVSGFETWGNNDIIDIVINNSVNVMWVRVNGGDWNNNPSDNPATNTGGFEIIGGPFYPVLCPAYEGTMIIQNSPKFSVPSGYLFLGNTLASVGFNRSKLLTENSFVSLTNGLFGQNFTGGTQCKTWLNSNGYWTSYSDTWQYDSANFLPWTDNTTGYTLLTGGVTNTDDGYWNNPITIPTYYTNNQTSSSLYISTNAVVTLGSGYSNCCPDTPQDSSNPALISGNAGDMFANPGQSLTDGTVMNAYYRITQNGDKTKIELKIFQSILSAQNTPYSYQLNLYRDSTYQWVETRVKSNTAGTVGPYNSSDVSQPASTVSRVWRGDLLGQNWVYLGTGIVI